MDIFDQKKVLESFEILVDTREQLSKRAEARYTSFGSPYKRATLNYGDYTYNAALPDGTNILDVSDTVQPLCAVERKMNLDELAQCFTHSRARFEREFKRAKEQLKGNLALSFESTSARMIHLARTEYYHNRFISLEEIFDKIDSVTKEQIEQLASKMLVTSEWSACVLGNVDKDFDLKSLVK